jgi:hypothetical protein
MAVTCSAKRRSPSAKLPLVALRMASITPGSNSWQEKTRLTIVPALDDVQGHVRENDSRASRHGQKAGGKPQWGNHIPAHKEKGRSNCPGLL